MTHLETVAAATTPEQRAAAAEEHAEMLQHELGTQRLAVRAAREYADELEAAAAAARDEIAALRTQLQRLSEECADLQHLVDTDALTGTGSRSWLADAWDQMKPAGIILLDLDGFKEINDRLGHEAGDDVLCEVAARLETTRPGGIARLGGDEFAVIIPAGEDPATLADRITLAVTTGEISTYSGQVTVTASVGVAPAGPDLSVTLRRADVAMYHAKRCEGCERHDGLNPGPVAWQPGMTAPPLPEHVRRQVRRCAA